MKGDLKWGNRRVRCNTDKARRIGTCRVEDHTETLYRNKDGAFFLHMVGGNNLYKLGPRGIPRRLTEEEAKEGCLRLVAAIEAKAWCEEHLTKAEYTYIFQGMPDVDDEKAWEKDDLWMTDPNRLTENFVCTLPTGLVQMINKAADADGVARSRIVEQALVVYFATRREAE